MCPKERKLEFGDLKVKNDKTGDMTNTAHNLGVMLRAPTQLRKHVGNI